MSFELYIDNEAMGEIESGQERENLMIDSSCQLPLIYLSSAEKKTYAANDSHDENEWKRRGRLVISLTESQISLQ